MSTSKHVRIGGLVAVLAVAAVVALAFGHSQAGSSVAGAPDGAMAIDCDASQAGVQANCTYAPGTTFNINVNVTSLPADGYFGFQAKVRWTDGIVNYVPTEAAADEALWPDCTIAARSINTPGDPSVLLGCVPFPSLGAGSTVTGPIVTFEFNCKVVDPADLSPPGSTPLASLMLVPEAGDIQNGTHFLDANGNRVQPALTDASVTCADEEPTPPTPTPTEGEPGVTPTEGAPTGTPEGIVVAATVLPETGIGFTSTGSGGDAGVWALIGALIAAGAAGLAGFGWRYARR